MDGIAGDAKADFDTGALLGDFLDADRHQSVRQVTTLQLSLDDLLLVIGLEKPVISHAGLGGFVNGGKIVIHKDLQLPETDFTFIILRDHYAGTTGRSKNDPTQQGQTEDKWQ